MPRHVYECPVRWADIDSLGHVNNVAYVDYMQEARVDMLAIHPGETGRHALGEGVVVVRHEVEFVRPLVFRFAPVRVEIWVEDVRAGSFTLRTGSATGIKTRARTGTRALSTAGPPPSWRRTCSPRSGHGG